MRFGCVGLFGLLGCLAGMVQAQAQPQDPCVDIHASSGWHQVDFGGVSMQVGGIYGSWTVDPALDHTDWRGHQGSDAQRLAPHSAFKYDEAFASGALLIRARGGERNYAVRPSRAGSGRTIIHVEVAELRINDSDASLGDNEGSLQVCFEEVHDQPASAPPSASRPQVAAAPPRPQSQPASSRPAPVDRSAWMACFNDSRQSDADRTALRRQASQLNREGDALRRRRESLQNELNHASYSYNRDPYGVVDRARANQDRRTQERIDAYRADLRALDAWFDAYDRQISAFNARYEAWTSRCNGQFSQSAARPLVEQYCVGSAARTSFCETFPNIRPTP